MVRANNSPVEVHREGLLLEGALASDALGHGLTALRSYDFADKGRFFSGMFALTIGLERLLKLVFLISKAEDSGRFPNNKELKDVGHDVGCLITLARSINEDKSLGADTTKVDDELCAAIIELFSRFAKYARYYNLDSMTGSTGSADEEPLAAWPRRRHGSRTASPPKDKTASGCDCVRQCARGRARHCRIARAGGWDPCHRHRRLGCCRGLDRDQAEVLSLLQPLHCRVLRRGA